MIEFFLLFINHSHALWRSEAFVRWLVASFAWWTEKSWVLWWRNWLFRRLPNIHRLIQEASLDMFCRFFGLLLTFHISCDPALYVSINFLRALSDDVLLGGPFLHVSDRLTDDFSLLVFFENLIGYLGVLAEKCLPLIKGLLVPKGLCRVSSRWSLSTGLSWRWDCFKLQSLLWRLLLCWPSSWCVVRCRSLEACIDIQVDALLIHLHVSWKNLISAL